MGEKPYMEYGDEDICHSNNEMRQFQVSIIKKPPNEDGPCVIFTQTLIIERFGEEAHPRGDKTGIQYPKTKMRLGIF